MPEKDSIDRLLDSALATYADPGVDSGLEQGVLSSLAAARAAQENRSAREWLRLAWAIAVPIAASLLLWVSIARINRVQSVQNEEAHRSDRVQTAPVTPSHASTPNTKAEIHPQGTKARVRPGLSTARAKPCPFKTGGGSHCAPPPKLDVFPAPQPLSPEEQALVATSKSGSTAQRDALLESQQSPDKPLSIAALNIPPLTASSEGKN